MSTATQRRGASHLATTGAWAVTRGSSFASYISETHQIAVPPSVTPGASLVSGRGMRMVTFNKSLGTSGPTIVAAENEQIGASPRPPLPRGFFHVQFQS